MQPITRAQTALASLFLVAAAACLVYLPFEADYGKKGDNSRARLGYFFVWSPPTAVDVCINTFGMSTRHLYSAKQIRQQANRSCFVRPNLTQAFTSVFSLVLLAIGSSLLLGLRSRKAKVSSFAKVQSQPPTNSESESGFSAPDKEVPTDTPLPVPESWILVNEFNGSRTFVDRDSISAHKHLVAADVIYLLRPYGTDKRNNRGVKQMHMREEYDLSKDRFRVHRLVFVYDDDTLSQQLDASAEWKPAADGNQKTLLFLKRLAGTSAGA